MVQKMKLSRLFVKNSVLCVMLLTFGCATSVQKAVPDLSLREKTQKIILMPMDIELSALTAGGILEPNASWTEDAKIYVHSAISEKISSEYGAEIIELKSLSHQLNSEEQKLQVQLVKLHEAVGQSILRHKYIQLFNLPNKKDIFDWTLGEKAKFLKEKFNADYALFIYLRDSYSTGGRVAVIIVGAAMGVGVPGGQQVGFASLVDLNTGKVIWFNRLIRGAGDLRNKENAASSVDLLLYDFPS